MDSNGLTPAPETGPSAAGPNEEADATSLDFNSLDPSIIAKLAKLEAESVRGQEEAQRQFGDCFDQAEVQMTVVSQGELTRAHTTNETNRIIAHMKRMESA